MTTMLRRAFSVSTRVKYPSNQYAFYNLVLNTPTNPHQVVESRSYEGNYYIDPNLTAEQRIAKVFGGRIKGESRESSSRIMRGDPKVIAGVTVPAKPSEPDNCCMSGCINCVWELFNDDVKDWTAKRNKAVDHLSKTDQRWPEDFDAPVRKLQRKNLPLSMANTTFDSSGSESSHKSEEEEAWGEAPMSIRVFAEMEKKMKERARLRAAQA